MDSSTYQEIAERAYAIWEREGRPQGCNLEHWLAAERELSAPGHAPTAAPSPRPSRKAASGNANGKTKTSGRAKKLS